VLSYWQPGALLGDDERRQWLEAAERIVRGLRLLAHLDAFTDARALRVGFTVGGDEALAARYVAAIAQENVEARQTSAMPDQTVVPPRGAVRRALRRIVDRLTASLPADEVLLPCAPHASSEEITHVVLAALKASHALEFGIELPESGDLLA
jgi:hypothetical protein